MKRINDENKKYYYLGLTLFISLSLVVIVSTFLSYIGVAVSIIWKIIGALESVWIGLIIAYLVNPIVKFFENKVFTKLFKGKHKGAARGLSVAISIILLLALLMGLMVLVIPQLVTTVTSLAQNLPSYYNNVHDWMADFAQKHPSIGDKVMGVVDGAYDKIIDWIQHDLLQNANALGTVTSGLMSAVGFVVNFFVGIIISIYLLCDRENFIMQTRKFLASIFSKKWYDKLMTVCSETHHVFGEFITGKLLDSLLVGIVTFIFMWLTGMPYATLVSVLLAVCNLIPFFGMFIGIIPSFLLILVISPVQAIIWLVVIVVYMQIDGNIISPKILGNSIGIGSFWILFAIMFFGGLFGVVGMLVGVPVFAMIYRLVRYFMNKRLEKKGMPTEAYEYKPDL